jgi:carboxylate-amine ligase
VVAFAALWRALAATLLAADAASLPPAASRVEVLRASRWQAARYGLGERLIDPVGGRPVPAADAVARLLDLVRPALDEAGDTERVDACIEELLRTGTSAQRQRERFAATESLTDVVEQIRRETAAL